MASMSQWEREVIVERTKDALRHEQGNRESVGTVPFGYHLAAHGIHLQECAQEQEILQRIAELTAANYTLREIADELNRQGYRTRAKWPDFADRTWGSSIYKYYGYEPYWKL